jgi:hypothetical protein
MRHNAQGVFKLLNYHNHDLTFDHLADIWKQSALEEDVEGPGAESERKERTMMVTILTEGLGFFEADIKMFEQIHSKQHCAANGQKFIRMLA